MRSRERLGIALIILVTLVIAAKSLVNFIGFNIAKPEVPRDYDQIWDVGPSVTQPIPAIPHNQWLVEYFDLDQAFVFDGVSGVGCLCVSTGMEWRCILDGKECE